MYEAGSVLRARFDVLFPGSGIRRPLGKEWFVLVLDSPAEPFDPDFPDLRVAPISFDITKASDCDVLIAPSEWPGKRWALVEVWNQRSMLEANVDSFIGRVADPALRVAFQVNNVMLGLEDERNVPRDRIGAPLTSESDPRIDYQADRARLAEFLSAPADDLWQHARQLRPAANGAVALGTVCIPDHWSEYEPIRHRWSRSLRDALTAKVAERTDDDWSDTFAVVDTFEHGAWLTCQWMAKNIRLQLTRTDEYIVLEESLDGWANLLQAKTRYSVKQLEPVCGIDAHRNAGTMAASCSPRVSKSFLIGA